MHRAPGRLSRFVLAGRAFLAPTSAERRALAVYCLKDDTPEIHGDAWVAPNAVVVGKVQLHKGSSVWFSATVRGDTEPITVVRYDKLMNVLITDT